tara:strand:+ start:1525 stop:3087 length:1563 start_codon:yes stop_codon:yes gene_type:complete
VIFEDIIILKDMVPWLILFVIIFSCHSNYVKGLGSMKENGSDQISSGAFTKLGMIGTIVGIIFLFINFDIGSTNLIIKGLSLALLSTLIGLCYDYRYQNQKKEIGLNEDDSDISVLVKSLASIKDAISNDLKTSLKSELQESKEINKSELEKLNISFKNFTNEMAKNNTEALIKAVEEVMQNFNMKINDNLGDAFKALNSSVENLVIWQQGHIKHLEITKSQIDTSIDSINKCSTSLRDVSKDMSELTQSSTAIKVLTEQVGVLVDKTTLQTNDLEKYLAAFAEMKTNAITAMPFIEENLNRLTNELKIKSETIMNNLGKTSSKFEELSNEVHSNMSDFSTSYKLMIDDQRKEINNQMGIIKESIMEHDEQNKKMVESVVNNITNTSTTMKEQVKDQMDSIKSSMLESDKQYKKLVESIDNNIEKSTSGMHETVNNQVQQLRKSSEELIKEVQRNIIDSNEEMSNQFENFRGQLQSEVEQAIKLLVNKYTGFQDKFIDTHKRMLSTIDNHTNNSMDKYNR